MNISNRQILSWISTIIIICCFDSHNSRKDITIVSIYGTDRATAYSMQDKIVDLGNDKILILVSTIHNNNWLRYMRSKFENDILNELRILTFQRKKSYFKPWHTYSTWAIILDKKAKKVISKKHIGYQNDNHGGGSVAIDKDGFIHIVHGPHHHAIRYKKSLKPYSIDEFSNEQYISATKGLLTDQKEIDTLAFSQELVNGEFTYPIIKIDSKNNLHIIGSTKKSAVYIQKIGDDWMSPQTLYTIPEKGIIRYDIMMEIDQNDYIHVSLPHIIRHYSADKSQRTYDLTCFYLLSKNLGKTFTIPKKVFNPTLGQGRTSGKIIFGENNEPSFFAFQLAAGKNSKGWMIKVKQDSVGIDTLSYENYSIWNASLLERNGAIFLLCNINQNPNAFRDITNEIALFNISENEDTSYLKLLWKYKHPAKNTWLPSAKFDETGLHLIWTEESSKYAVRPFRGPRNFIKTEVLYQHLSNDIILN